MSSLKKVGVPTLLIITMDLQIEICTFLHPSDILALRKTCKIFHFTTKRRIVWIDALRRVCFDNTLFLPSFPIAKMSDVDLERAAMAPYRWMRLCAANRLDATLFPVAQRTIQSPRGRPSSFYSHIFLVPGGRYLVRPSCEGLDVWDLGYASNTECKLLASIPQKEGPCVCNVSATSDGTGLIILAYIRDTYRWSVYEIYPDSVTPQLTEVAHANCDPISPWRFLLPDRVVWYYVCDDRIVFTVWDYRLNHSASFSAGLDVGKFGGRVEVVATKTALVVLSGYEETIIIWAIPPLSRQPPNFKFRDANPAHIPPLFRIPFPDGLSVKGESIRWKTISSWYYGSSQPLYFEISCRDYQLRGFEIVIKPDLSDAFLRVMNTSQMNPADFIGNRIFEKYTLCEDMLVSWWASDGEGRGGTNQCIIPMLSRPPTAILSGGPSTCKILLPRLGHTPSYSCPASGRFVYPDGNNNLEVVIVDFLP